MATILLLSTADTELLAARASGADYRVANPARLAGSDPGALAPLTDGADIIVLRLLGGRQAWPAGVAALRATGLPLVALGGEATPDAELMAASTVPAGVAAGALAYLREGGPRNLRELAAFLSGTVLLTGEGFAPPEQMPAYGVHRWPGTPSSPARPDTEIPGTGAPEAPGTPADGSRPTVAVVYYRAHELSGNTGFVDTLCQAIADLGGTPLPVYCPSLRSADPGLLGLLRPANAVITTVLAAGGATAADTGAEGDWDAGALARLGVPLIQGLCLTSSRAEWAGSPAALSPVDAAMQVAIPEFDGRLITVPFSFKEEGQDGIPVYRADPERASRLAGIAVRHARLAAIPNPVKRVAIMLSSYPTKHSRVGNAVGLDTPASAVRLLRAMADAGYDLGDGFPDDGDALVHALIAAGGYDTEWLTEEQLRTAQARVPLAAYREWLSSMPDGFVRRVTSHWGEPPGELYTDAAGDIVLAALRFGNVVVMVQPPRGFGENPVAIYHDPDLPPSHHYLAAYRWLDQEFGADAIVHLGKHGTLEWLPGKGLGLSAECAPDAVLRDIPLVYPFIVNDPGEGTQAKRRAHAVIVDHLVPPMARADTYGDLARLEQLLDEYATVAALDPDKLPAVRSRIWSLVRAAQLHHDLGVDAEPGAAEFDDFVLHVDGYLCEVKDAAIRDGLHVLGEPPAGDALVNLVLVILRSPQVWSARWGALPGLRETLGFTESAGGGASLAETDAFERTARALIEAMAAAGWDGAQAAAVAAQILTPPPPEAVPPPPEGMQRCHRIPSDVRNGTFADMETPAGEPATTGEGQPRKRPSPGISGQKDEMPQFTPSPGPDSEGPDSGGAFPAGGEGMGTDASPPFVRLHDDEQVARVARVLQFACEEVVPRLAATRGEIGAVLTALAGGYVPAGPSGSPTRGLVNVLPTGRNFYSVDPKAIPSPTSWETGAALAESLLARHLADEGTYPRCVGLTVWGTSAMRTQGDDIAEVLALIGCRPAWDERSRRVTGFEVVPPGELGRPRIDVTLRISGFFRDAFPHVIALLDDAITTVAGLDEPEELNYLRAHAAADHAAHGDWRRATTRIFGSRPGAYGAGLLPLIDARNWRDDADLAEVYAVWGGYAYGRGLDGADARPDMENAYRRIAVAAKNTDTREHDIADSDDYFQYHGGMVAMVRALAGRSPAAYIGDSAVPGAVRTRTLAEETRRVFRSRVVNPRWIAAMRRHGYKGAFEMAATVDYLFGYDATAGVVADWMYSQLAAAYVLDPENREFLEKSNPWALRGIAERLLEAAQRGMWAKPDAATLDRLRQVYLETEGDLEGGAAG
ncbi:MAG TPA: cobaltochelatase subunit CobN [Streptosporangiaceae bacterium]|nr:cobaltochelatase subunit CobN [Streptosporangiaceae bacterium]